MTAGGRAHALHQGCDFHGCREWLRRASSDSAEGQPIFGCHCKRVPISTPGVPAIVTTTRHPPGGASCWRPGWPRDNTSTGRGGSQPCFSACCLRAARRHTKAGGEANEALSSTGPRAGHLSRRLSEASDHATGNGRGGVADRVRQRFAAAGGPQYGAAQGIQHTVGVRREPGPAVQAIARGELCADGGRNRARLAVRAGGHPRVGIWSDIRPAWRPIKPCCYSQWRSRWSRGWCLA